MGAWELLGLAAMIAMIGFGVWLYRIVPAEDKYDPHTHWTPNYFREDGDDE